MRAAEKSRENKLKGGFRFRWLLLGELLIVLGILLTALLPKLDRSFTAQELKLMQGLVDEEGNACIDSGSGQAGIFLATPQLDLGYGTYTIDIDYITDGPNNFAYVTLPKIMTNEENVDDRFVTNVSILVPGKNSAAVEVLMKSRQKETMIAVFYMGEGSLAVEGIHIRQTCKGVWRIALCACLLFAAADAALWAVLSRRRGRLSDESLRTGFFLGGIILFASIPQFLSYLLEGHDLTFHLMRIEGLAEGIRMGTFPVKIQPNWLNGGGYAVSVFYGDLFLYIPALLRLWGFSITESYNFYVILTHAATCLISYFCFKGIGGKRNAAAAGSLLYTLSMYRMINLYVRSAVGEYSAMTFLPLILYGLWKILTEDINGEGYGKNWILPVLGFTGIINTHILSCAMVGAFILLLCLIFIKRVFRKKTFLVLVKIVVYTCILNLGFLVPFLDYSHQGGFNITDGKSILTGIQQFGAFVGQLLVPFTGYSGLTCNVSEGMAQEMPVTTGLAVVLGAVVLVYIWVSRGIEEKKYRLLAGISIGFGVFAMWLSTHLFPWDLIQGIHPFFKKIILSFQFPWRFLTIAALMFSAAAVLALKLFEERGEKAFVWAAAALTAVCLLQSGSFMSDIMNNSEPSALYTASALDSTNVIGGEYLPTEVSLYLINGCQIEADAGITVKQTARDNNRIRVYAENSTAEAGRISLPLVYYKGYSAKDTATGQEFEVYSGEGSVVGVVIPAGYSGELLVEFTGFWYWNGAAVVSLLAFVFMVLSLTNGDEWIKKKIKQKLPQRSTGKK